MNAALPPTDVHPGTFMSGAEYRDSLRRLKPRVYVDGQLVDSVADAPALLPGIQALAVSYDFARDAAQAPLMTAVPLQILACEIAAARGHDVDQPRNLAKSVTVE